MTPLERKLLECARDRVSRAFNRIERDCYEQLIGAGMLTLSDGIYRITARGLAALNGQAAPAAAETDLGEADLVETAAVEQDAVEPEPEAHAAAENEASSEAESVDAVRQPVRQRRHTSRSEV